MKQKINNNSPVTKAGLTEILKDYPTKKDLKREIKEALSNYPTNDEFSKRLNASFEAFRQENNHNFQMMMDRFDEKFSKFTNLILTAIDPLLKEIETRREDREIASEQSLRFQDKLDDHEKRLKILEHS